jgi:hypothetical protein
MAAVRAAALCLLLVLNIWRQLPGRDEEHIAAIVQSYGGQYRPSVTKEVTHLICIKPVGVGHTASLVRISPDLSTPAKVPSSHDERTSAGHEGCPSSMVSTQATSTVNNICPGYLTRFLP